MAQGRTASDGVTLGAGVEEVAPEHDRSHRLDRAEGARDVVIALEARCRDSRLVSLAGAA
jgi:hypothetical protein